MHSRVHKEQLKLIPVIEHFDISQSHGLSLVDQLATQMLLLCYYNPLIQKFNTLTTDSIIAYWEIGAGIKINGPKLLFQPFHFVTHLLLI